MSFSCFHILSANIGVYIRPFSPPVMSKLKIKTFAREKGFLIEITFSIRRENGLTKAIAQNLLHYLQICSHVLDMRQLTSGTKKRSRYEFLELSNIILYDLIILIFTSTLDNRTPNKVTNITFSHKDFTK